MKVPAMKFLMAGGLALLVAAPTVASADRIEELYKKASKEGKVIFYTTARKSYNRKISKFWKKKFPEVKLTLLRKQSPKVVQTVEAERAAGGVRADVVSLSIPYQGPLWKEQGLFEPYKPEQFDKIDARFKDPDGHWISRVAFLLLGAYNTNIIKDPGVLPKTLKGYLDPKWKGKLLSANPETAGSSRTFFGGLIQTGLGSWEYLEKLAKQDLMFVRSNGVAARMVVAGERQLAVAISSHNIVVAMGKGQPIKWFAHEDGVIPNQSPMGIVKGAKHPWAAKLLVEWQFTDEGQAQMAKWGKQWSVMKHIDPPKGMPNMFDFKLRNPNLSFLIKEQKQFLNRFNKTFGRN